MISLIILIISVVMAIREWLTKGKESITPKFIVGGLWLFLANSILEHILRKVLI